MASSTTQNVRGPRLQISTQAQSRPLAPSTKAPSRTGAEPHDLYKQSRIVNLPLSSLSRSNLLPRKAALPFRSSTAVPNTSDTLPPIKKLARSLTAVDYTTSYEKDLRLQRMINGNRPTNDRGDKRKPVPRMLDVNHNPYGFAKSTSTENVTSVGDCAAESDKPVVQMPRKVRALTAYEKCITRLERAASAPDMGRMGLEGMKSKSIKRYMYSVAELKARFNKLAVIREELEVHPALPLDCRTPVPVLYE